jgi:hypothetical protein
MLTLVCLHDIALRCCIVHRVTKDILHPDWEDRIDWIRSTNQHGDQVQSYCYLSLHFMYACCHCQSHDQPFTSATIRPHSLRTFEVASTCTADSPLLDTSACRASTVVVLTLVQLLELTLPMLKVDATAVTTGNFWQVPSVATNS